MKTKICPYCVTRKKHFAKGFCQACYMRNRRSAINKYECFSCKILTKELIKDNDNLYCRSCFKDIVRNEISKNEDIPIIEKPSIRMDQPKIWGVRCPYCKNKIVTEYVLYTENGERRFKICVQCYNEKIGLL